MRDKTLPLVAGMFVVMAALSACPVGAATPERVDEAIARGVKFLESSERNGSWEVSGTPAAGAINDPNALQWGGTSAIATYALICAGEKQLDPPVASAVAFLSTHRAQGVYAAAARCLVWSRIPLKPNIIAAASEDVKFLLSAVKTQGAGTGLFFYVPPASPADGTYDHSASQFAVLGLSVLVPEGLEIPMKFWETTDQAWRNHQDPDGSWGYTHEGTPVPYDSMTAAGVATLFITTTQLHGGGDCHGSAPDANIDRGIAWIAKQGGDALVAAPRGGFPFQNYAQFTASRVGVASGYKFFGNIDWYQRGADYLISSQRPDGSWSGYGPVPAETALAVLALTYGSAPVAVNKLQYALSPAKGHEDAAHWNQRPQDLLNLTDWMGHELEQRLNWQIVPLGSASLDDLHEAPILYLSGDQSIELSPADCDKLREFSEQGGLILGNADCGSIKFTKSFQKLGETLFHRYEFRQLPAAHPIFTGEQFHAAKWRAHPGILGMSNGVRELMLLPNADLSRAFQSRNTQLRPEFFQLADNIILYCAPGAHLRRKGESYMIKPDPSIATDRSIKIARLSDAGNWDPEPGGWQQFKTYMRNTCKVDLAVQTVKLGDAIPHDIRFAHLTGTEPVRFGDAERAAIQQYVQGGGTLIIDAAGGSGAFASGIEAELAKMFGSDATAGLATPLPRSSPVYQLEGRKIDSVAYRPFTRGKYIGKLNDPRIFGISRGGRIIVYYSREDLSNGLVGAPVDGVAGYEPQSARALMRNIILSVGQ